MSRQLTLDLSEEVYDAINRAAQATGRSPAQLVATTLERDFGSANPEARPSTIESEVDQKRRRRFRDHFGAVSLGRPTGADNESIDADLAREYGDDHEED